MMHPEEAKAIQSVLEEINTVLYDMLFPLGQTHRLNELRNKLDKLRGAIDSCQWEE